MLCSSCFKESTGLNSRAVPRCGFHIQLDLSALERASLRRERRGRKAYEDQVAQEQGKMYMKLPPVWRGTLVWHRGELKVQTQDKKRYPMDGWATPPKQGTALEGLKVIVAGEMFYDRIQMHGIQEIPCFTGKRIL